MFQSYLPNMLTLLTLVAIISAPVQGSLMWVYFPNAEVLFQPISGEPFTIYCFTANSDYSLSFKLNNQTLSANENITIDPLHIPPAVGKQLGVAIKAFSTATAGILTCQAHSSDNLIQEISETITGQNYSLSIVGNDSLIEGHSHSLYCLFYSPGRNASSYSWRGRRNESQEFVLLAGNSSILNIIDSSLIFDEYSCEVSISPTNFKLTTNRTVTAYFIPELTANNTIASTALIGDNITLHCSITGTGVKYTWSRQDGVPLSSLQTLTLYSVSYDSAGVYQCTASNLAGNETQIHNVTIQGPPQSLVNSPVTIRLIENEAISLLCPFTSVPSATVQWYNGSRLLVDNDRVTLSYDTLRVSSASISDAGVYRCNVTNQYGGITLLYKVIIIGTPPPPQNFALSNVTPFSVSLSWLHTSSELVEPDWFIITINGTQVLNVSGDVTTATMNGLVPGNYYSVQVFAVNIGGVSEPSQMITFSTNKTSPRLAYLNATGLVGGRSLLLSWSLLHDGGSDITSFTITVNGLVTLSPDLSTGSLMIHNLEPLNDYMITSSISNLIGQSSESVTITTARGPPGPSTTPRVTDVGMTDVTLQFSFPSIGSEVINNYIVNISNSESELVTAKVPVTRQPLPGENITILVTSLSKGESYSFSVSGETEIGRGEFSNYTSIVTTGTDSLLLYYIIVPISSIFLLVLLLLIVSMVCLCVIKRRQHTKHTITRFSRRNMYTNSMFPSSSMCDKDSQPIGSEADSPPQSSLGLREDPLVLTHHRTQSVSSNASSHFTLQSRKAPGGNDHSNNMFLSPFSPPHETADSAYGGSAEKVNHTYAEIGGGGSSVASEKPFFNSPSINRPFFSSAPMINKKIFDADIFPVNVHNYATDV